MVNATYDRYFLITPKLLNGLLYHPRMKVHCIYSGQWIAHNLKFDINKALKAGETFYGTRKRIRGHRRRQHPESEEEEEEVNDA